MNRYPGKQFHTAAPEQEGVFSSAIEKLLTRLECKLCDIHSLLIWRHGALLHEQYYAPYTAETAHCMYSCSKTFTSMLIGVAQGKGLLSVEDTVLSFFPDVPVDAPSDNLRAMKIKHLLMMGCGHNECSLDSLANSPDGDWVRTFLNLPVPNEPGTHFVYNTGGSYMLSAILTKVTGKTELELANEWLFGPLGIEDAHWDADPRGISLGGTGLHVRPRDILKLGVLILSHGRWKDKQLIPADYIAEAQRVQISNRNPDDPKQSPHWAAGYGYQMWRCGFDAFRADGMGGQYIVMLPKYDMVIAITSGVYDMGYVLDAIRDCLLPGVTPCAQIPVPAETESLAALSRRLAAPEAVAVPEIDFPFGKKLVLPENESGLAALTVRKDELDLYFTAGPSLLVRGTGLPEIPFPQPLTLKLGWNAPEVTEGTFPLLHKWMLYSDGISVVAREEEGKLFILVNFLGEPFIYSMSLAPAGESVRATIFSNLITPVEAVCLSEDA